MLNIKEEIVLTKFAHGAGCGCKISPQALKEILEGQNSAEAFQNLLVGNESHDDAAVYDLGNGTALISTTDFFTPIVDNAFDFGRIAAANAISDVYAMGGTPTLALAILGWPVNKLPLSEARRVMEGARMVCKQANIPLAGGHSVDTSEPLFGLSVNGLVKTENLKRNNTAHEGDFIFMTKALGVGVLSTAMKRGLLRENDKTSLINQLVQLNSFGEKLGAIQNVSAITDITGFGLAGHLIEMAEGSNLTAVLNYESIPKVSGLDFYLKQQTIPDATFRNWNAYNQQILFGDQVNVAEAFQVLPDPQTNGGLLFSVNKNGANEIILLMKENGLEDFVKPVGVMVTKEEKVLRIEK